MSRKAKKTLVWLCVLGLIVYHVAFGVWGNRSLWLDWLPLPGFFILLETSVISFLILLLFTKWVAPNKIPQDILTRDKKEGL